LQSSSIKGILNEKTKEICVFALMAQKQRYKKKNSAEWGDYYEKEKHRNFLYCSRYYHRCFRTILLDEKSTAL
jgi:hypothetical protein